MIINDWLAQEFRQRVNIRKKVILTDKLTHGFKLANISVKKKEVDDEAEMLSELKNLGQKRLLELERARKQEVDELMKELLGK